MIMISDSSYSRSLAAARCDHNTGNPLREFFAYIPALWNVRSSGDIRFSIGSIIATFWSYEILKSGNLLSPLLWLAIIARGIVLRRLGLNRRQRMSKIGSVHLSFLLVFFSSLSVFGQWSPADSGTTSNLNGAVLLDSGTGFVVGDTGTILKSTDAGATWAPLTSGTTTALHGVYFLDPNEGVAVGDNGTILRTTDGGAAWQSVASGVVDNLRSVSLNGANGICGGDSQDILYSTDSGASWQISQSGFFGGGFLGAQMLSATTGFVAGQNSIFQALVGTTTDGGASWAFQPFYFDGNEGGANDVFFLDPNTGVVSGSVFDGRGAIARTTDAGMNWSTLFFDQAIEGVAFPTAASGFAVGAVGRILHTTDTGTTWTDQTSGSSANLHDISFASDALRGITVGDGGVILLTTTGGEPSPTPSPTPTPTLTPTPRPTPTPRSRPSPRPRPTPPQLAR
jgi:photosystem II stability/assembly factor-like uncharacterized protein